MPYNAVHTLYKQIVDLHAPIPGAINPTTKQKMDVSYNYATPTFASVKAYYATEPEVDVSDSSGGRAKKVRLQNFDKFKFYCSDIPSEADNIAQAGLAIEDTWLIHLKTPNHPFYGKWFVVEGNAMRKFLLCYAQVFVRRTAVPGF